LKAALHPGTPSAKGKGSELQKDVEGGQVGVA